MSLLERLQSNRFLQNRRFMQQRIREQRLANTFHPVTERRDRIAALDQEVARLLAVSHAWDEQGSPRGRSAEIFQAIAAIQDEAAAEMGLDALGVRVIGTPYWGDNLGHLAMLDVFVKLRHLGRLSPETRLVSLEHPANEHYLRFWGQHLPRLTMSKNELRDLNRSLSPLQECTPFFRTTTGVRDLYEVWLEANSDWGDRPPLLVLSDDDHEWGRGQLERLGVEPDTWFVSLHVRSGDPRVEKSGRNADIHSYIPATQRIVAEGGVVIRMGNPLMPRLPDIEGVIDYAHSPLRNQRLDVYLFAACRFFIGTNSGPLCAPPTFGVPVLATDWSPIGFFPLSTQSLMLPKRYVHRVSGTDLPVSEQLASSVGWSENPRVEASVREQNNSAEELVEAVDEMIERTGDLQSRSWRPSAEQQEAQDRLLSLSHLNGAIVARGFLRRYPDWVGPAS